MVEAGLSEEVVSEEGQKAGKEGHGLGGGREHAWVRGQQEQKPWGRIWVLFEGQQGSWYGWNGDTA